MESVDAWNEAFRAGADGYLEKRELLGLDPRKIVLMILNLVERNRLRRQAEETNRRQAELLSVLSHDVRAPFQTLLGTIELLKINPGPRRYSQHRNALPVRQRSACIYQFPSGVSATRIRHGRSPSLPVWTSTFPSISHFKGWAFWLPARRSLSIASSNRACQR